MGQGGGRDRSGGRRGVEHSAIVSWGSTGEATIDSEEEEVRRRGAWELEAAAVESTAARRGYTTGAAWDEGNMIQAMARLKHPAIAWRKVTGGEMEPPLTPPPPPPSPIGTVYVLLTPSSFLGLSRDCCRL